MQHSQNNHSRQYIEATPSIQQDIIHVYTSGTSIGQSITATQSVRSDNYGRKYREATPVYSKPQYMHAWHIHRHTECIAGDIYRPWGYTKDSSYDPYDDLVSLKTGTHKPNSRFRTGTFNP